MLSVMKRSLIVAIAAALVFTALPAFAGENATGLARALQVANSTMERAQQNAQSDDVAVIDNTLKGRERAKAAIDKALARGNGNGNAFGRGRAAEVHAILLAGGSPSELANHGQAVKELVHAYNALRKELRGSD